MREETPQYAAIPIIAAWTGLRPEEWIALERGDVDGDVIHIRRVYADGEVKTYGKNQRSLRAVPLPLKAAEAIKALPPRLDTRLLFPAERGGYVNLDYFRRNVWTPAVKAAGLAGRTPYSLRHAYASWSIRSGIGLFELSRMMGTSVEQIDRTHGNLLPDSLDRARAALNTFAATNMEGEAREIR